MNLALATDSYKLNHWNQYPPGTEGVYSYFESRKGSEFPYTVFFGLLPILDQLAKGITQDDIDNAAAVAEYHFGNPDYFNRAGWQHILDHHGGKLPLRIKAVPEGSVIPTGNVLMTVENTDPADYWLTNFVESLLTHVWYPSTVATLSRFTKQMIAHYLGETADSFDGLHFMLHDFGYRGVSSHESAQLGGAGHLVNFLGTDTLPAMELLVDTYGASLDGLAYSVAATEHSVMTAEGPDGEEAIVGRLLEEYPTGILSVVADSYDIYNFVTNIVGTKYNDTIRAREGVFVVRPDSVTHQHATPEDLTLWIVEELSSRFGYAVNDKGFKVINPKVRVLWGDGIDFYGIERILNTLAVNKFSAENMVFGMGGGLLQKVNRDTQRFAFKSSAQKRDGIWHDVFKKPLDLSKMSKRGRLSLIEYEGKLTTISQYEHNGDLLIPVFENGEVLNRPTLAEIRDRAELAMLRTAAV